jgi:enamine deaminase RidA (YjgF/YER057c/UK114 family)
LAHARAAQYDRLRARRSRALEPEGNMRAGRAAGAGVTNRCSFLNGMTLAGAAALTPSSTRAAASTVRMAQASQGAGAASSAAALTVKSVGRLAGGSTNYAYAIKAGPWIFLNGHEAFDFERGPAPEVEGPPGYRLSGRPPLRREADYILARMRTILKEFGADLPNAVRVDQYYTKGAAVSAYHLARFAEFGPYIPPSTSIIMERCFAEHTNIHTSMIAVVPSSDGEIEKVTIPGEAITASGYNPAVVANDFVFVAGNMALARDGTLDPSVYIAPNRQWSGQTSFRRQVNFIVKQRLEPSLKAAGSGLEHSLKAQAYIRGVENFPDFLDAWSQHFRDIPCAVTLVPAKDYANSDSMLEINLIALKNGARRRREVVETGIPAAATFGPCVRAGELVFWSGLMAIDRDGRVPGAEHARTFDGLSLAGDLQGALLLSYMEAVCKAVGVPPSNVVRAQYFLTDVRDFSGISAAWSDRYGKRPHPFACVQVPAPFPAAGACAIGDFWIYAG